ncbi:MAG: hypothetical protein M4579_004546 [Chaenotheca gracillima]|nr:MAG: hypothetical protein M4579_004546 [Chaenotheca gracillima]
MTRAYYGSSPGAHYPYRQVRGISSQMSQERSVPLAASSSIRSNARSSSFTDRQSNVSGTPQDDAHDTATGPTRRRIAVAVNSVEYPAAGNFFATSAGPETSPLSQLGNNYGAYSSANSSSMASMSPGTANAASMYFTRLQSTPNYANTSYGNFEETNDSYSAVSPHYMLPSHEAQSGSNRAVYSVQDPSRAWHPISQSHRMPSRATLVDHDCSPSYGTATLPFLSPTASQVHSTTTAGNPLFPGMNSLVSSLPGSSPLGDRILPRPLQTHSNNLPEHGADFIPATSQTEPNLSYKPFQQSWESGNEPSVDCPSSSTTSSGTTASNVNGNVGIKSSSEENGYSFAQARSNPEPSSLTSSSMTYPSTQASTSAGCHSNYLGSSASMFSTATQNDSLHPTHGAPSNLYSYHTDYRRNSDLGSSGPEEGALINGQTYTRPRPIQTQLASSLDAIRTDPGDLPHPSHHPGFISGYSA